MINKYERTIPVKYWLIQLEDLKRVCELFDNRVKDRAINGDPSPAFIELKFRSGDTSKYKNFEEMKADVIRLSKLLEQGEVVQELRIASSASYPRNLNADLRIWLTINFDTALYKYFIGAEDHDGKLRDFVLGCVYDIEKLVISLTPKRDFLRALKSRFGKRKKEIIIFDISGVIKKSIDKELEIIKPTMGKKISKFVREHWIPVSFGFICIIVGGIAAIKTLLT